MFSGKYIRLFLFITLFPASVLGQTIKMQMEFVSPAKPFSMKVGEPLEIRFKAVSNRDGLYYAIFLKHGDSSPWENDSGPLSLVPMKLKQGENIVKWDGESFAWAPNDSSEMGKLKKDKSGRYYLQIYIFENEKAQLLGMLADYHKTKLFQIRSKNFTLK